MSRYGLPAVLLLAAAVGCSKQSEKDLAASRLECEALKADVTRVAAEAEVLKSELEKSKGDAAAARAELARARAEADEKLGRDIAEFFLTALARSDKNEAGSVCTAGFASRIYALSRRGWAWKIESQTIAPERDQVVIRGKIEGDQPFMLRMVHQGTTWKVDGFTFK